jgi:DNA repair exonuclease SbcCD ATPase subunit
MHIASIRFRNWLCYRGDHEVKLAPIPYAVTATRLGDAERSNWGGKTAFIEAPRFALTGEHRHRIEEGWISEGETEGEVDLTLDNGAKIRRWRKPGAGTQLEYITADGVLFTKDEAQRQIDALIGFGAEDLPTVFLAQGETAAFVKADPGVRTAMVVRWLKLEKVERCAEIVRKRATAADREAAAVRARIDAANERFQSSLAGADSIGVLEEELAQQTSMLAEWDDLVRNANEDEANARLLAERDRIVEEGKALRVVHDAENGEAIAATLADADAELDRARRALESARVKRANRTSVASGTFNGRCPVAGIDCPVASEINNIGEAARVEACAALEEEHAAHARVTKAQLAWRDANEKAVARHARAERLQTLRERAVSIAALPTSKAGGLALEAIRRERDAAAAAVVSLKNRCEWVVAAQSEVAARLKEERVHLRVMAACREATVLFTRAKRQMAEGAIANIVVQANRALAQAGIELGVDCTWERDTDKAAEACDACGAAFPASTRVKKCDVCGADRGKKRIQKFEVDLTSRSGAAEDLAGFVLWLAAGAWLRGDRGSTWAVFLADEPWAQLDRAHRRAASAYVPALLAAARIEQAMIISHDPVSVSSLPGRIEIVSDGRWARVTAA